MAHSGMKILWSCKVVPKGRFESYVTAVLLFSLPMPNYTELRHDDGIPTPPFNWVSPRFTLIMSAK